MFCASQLINSSTINNPIPISSLTIILVTINSSILIAENSLGEGRQLQNKNFSRVERNDGLNYARPSPETRKLVSTRVSEGRANKRTIPVFGHYTKRTWSVKRTGTGRFQAKGQVAESLARNPETGGCGLGRSSGDPSSRG